MGDFIIRVMYSMSKETSNLLAVISILCTIFFGVRAQNSSKDDGSATEVPRKRRRYLLSFVSCLFVIATLAFAGLPFWVTNYCEVPEVVGLSKDEAVTALSATNLKASDPLNADGRAIVWRQDPSKGKIIKKGTIVMLEFETVGPTTISNDDNSSIKIGDIISFGAYEQDGIQSNGAEPIEWQVLDIQDDSALLLSLHALDSQPYDETYRAVTWENCTLRHWLKNTFLKAAFTKEDQAAILLTKVDNGIRQSNKEWHVDGGNNTEDMIFLLSYAETNLYFDNHAARICTPTDYAVSMGAGIRTLDDGITDAGWWWLRSPGESSYQASFVNFDGTRYTNGVGNGYLSVRPALWLDLKKYNIYGDIQ